MHEWSTMCTLAGLLLTVGGSQYYVSWQAESRLPHVLHQYMVNFDPPRCHPHESLFHDFAAAKNAESGLGSETINQT